MILSQIIAHITTGLKCFPGRVVPVKLHPQEVLAASTSGMVADWHGYRLHNLLVVF